MTAQHPIVVGVDGSQSSLQAVSWAAQEAALRGAPLRVLFTSFYKPLFWLYAKPEIRDIKELKGKKIGTSGLGAAETLLREFLKKQGFQFDGVRAVLEIAPSSDTE